jgi:hypothetical protein
VLKIGNGGKSKKSDDETTGAQTAQTRCSGVPIKVKVVFPVEIGQGTLAGTGEGGGAKFKNRINLAVLWLQSVMFQGALQALTRSCSVPNRLLATQPG